MIDIFRNIPSLDHIKKMIFADKVKIKESILKTKIKFYVEGTDELIWEGSNKVILPGAGFIARGLFDLSNKEITPSYNTALGLDNTLYVDPLSTERTYLFCVGTDGCGTENSQVYTENYAKWIMPTSLVPFQYRALAKDLSNTERTSLYFGRKTLSNYYAYYFKAFESNPVFVQQYTDGTPIDGTVYTTTNSTPVETYVETRLKITKDDCRDYFIATTGINDAKVNTISLCTAWYKNIGGFNYYQNIRPVTKLNFPNEPLIDLLKGIDIVYQVYF